MTKRGPLRIKSGEHRVLELAEGPFVGEGKKLDKLWLDHLVGNRGLWRLFVNFDVLDQQALRDKLVVEPAGNESIVVFAVELVDLPPETIRPVIDEPGRISK